ncbi:MAG: hypothetical protein EOP40_18940 [Rubrivivax sp.]|nr:MAG: hypothetical protein EOP40_18940 [Rubrivivax sp.]
MSAAAPDTPAGTLVQATSHAIEPPARTPAQAAAALPPGTAATTSVSANASGHGQYCTAFVTRTQEALTLRAPVQPFPFMQDDRAAMRDALSALVAAVIQANPVRWTAFSPVTCYDNSGVHAGETMCVSVGARHFGGTQMAAQFCNGSKEMIDKRWADMVQADGDGARNVAWP